MKLQFSHFNLAPPFSALMRPPNERCMVGVGKLQLYLLLATEESSNLFLHFTLLSSSRYKLQMHTQKCLFVKAAYHFKILLSNLQLRTRNFS